MYTVPDQTGRRFIITGANSGTGKEAATRLAAAGAQVVLAVRNLDKGYAASDEIRRSVPDAELDVRHLDLAELSSVRDFAAGILEMAQPVSVLVNNAGVMAPPKRMLTVDGFELQFASNFLGPFALTNLLLPRILGSLEPRVTTMSSFVAVIGRIRFEDLQFTRGYSPYPAYAQSKLADLLLARHLASVAVERKWNLLSTAAHPGFTSTNLQSAGANLGRERPRKSLFEKAPFGFSQEVQQGAEPLLFAAADPEAKQGGYYGPSEKFGLVGPTRRTRLYRSARGADLAKSLWTVAEDLTGTTLPDL
ncbi:MAG: short chain dehydrogenase [Glaciihabitans sp.]|nr:short chain dehydrogenase [Glaciihabitans sp.]